MIRIITAIAVCLIGFICKAQVSENRTVANFTAIKASSAVSVIYTQSKTTAVKVVTDDEEKLKQIITEVKGNELKIAVKSKKGGTNFKTLKVYVSNPNITSLQLTSGARMTVESEIENSGMQIDISSGATFSGNIKATEVKVGCTSGAMYSGNIKSKEVKMECASGASFDGKINATALETTVTGGARAKISGQTEELKLMAYSGSACKAANLLAKNAVVNADNASAVTVNVSDMLDASSTSTSSIEYYGKPKKVTTHKKSLGTITGK